MQLRKCCNHPFLIKDMFNDLTRNCVDEKEYFTALNESSGKMILLDKLLDKF
jgi:chromodomain-helicase-DNA-binding protein 7